MQKDIYRLTLDENGEESIVDFTAQEDAADALAKAKRRATVFSAKVERYSEHMDRWTRVHAWERS